LNHFDGSTHDLGSPPESAEPMPLLGVILFDFISILFALAQAARPYNFRVAVIMIGINSFHIQQIIVIT
jgi:hypothetical protein